MSLLQLPPEIMLIIIEYIPLIEYKTKFHTYTIQVRPRRESIIALRSSCTHLRNMMTDRYLYRSFDVVDVHKSFIMYQPKSGREVKYNYYRYSPIDTTTTITIDNVSFVINTDHLIKHGLLFRIMSSNSLTLNSSCGKFNEDDLIVPCDLAHAILEHKYPSNMDYIQYKNSMCRYVVTINMADKDSYDPRHSQYEIACCHCKDFELLSSL